MAPERGTVTNEKGEYTLGNLTQDAVLVFSFVGMQTQEVTVGSRTRINVTMETDANQIEEVVVSYSSQKKTSLTASVGMIKNDKIYSKPVADVSSALVGRWPDSSRPRAPAKSAWTRPKSTSAVSRPSAIAVR